MSETHTLSAKKREKTGRHAASRERADRRVPAVLYGHGLESQHVSVDLVEFDRIYSEAGESSIVELVVEGGDAVNVLIQSVQRHPIKEYASHIDFYQVRMDEAITAEVVLEFTGVAPAVKELGGILVKNMDHVEVKCLPADLPHDIAVDITTLKTLDDNISVADLPKIEKVEYITDAERIVAAVSEPRSEEELEALNEDVVEDVDSVEVAGEKDAEGEEKEGDEKAGDKKEA
jgi:large subunit ribosomal protein L25